MSMKFLAVSTILAVAGLLVSFSVSASAAYPAAYFQPKVIYSAEGLTPATTAAAAPKVVEKSQPDPKYPAAYFEPKVIYSSK